MYFLKDKCIKLHFTNDDLNTDYYTEERKLTHFKLWLTSCVC